MKKMKIKCINNNGLKNLTVGKIYEVIRKSIFKNENYYYIVDDCGSDKIGYHQIKFEEV